MNTPNLIATASRALPCLTVLRIEDVLAARPLPRDTAYRPATVVWGKEDGLTHRA